LPTTPTFFVRFAYERTCWSGGPLEQSIVCNIDQTTLF
jgi:hypothetical protein